MNTIILTENDINKMVNYESDQFFDNFIFNDFRIIVKYESYKAIYKIYINGNVNKVYYRTIMNGSYLDCEFSFTHNEEAYEWLESPHGEYVDHMIECILKVSGEQLSDYEITQKMWSYFNTIVQLSIKVKQYIMNESYKRVTITKECETREIKTDNIKNKVGGKRTGVQYLLDDVVNYVSHNHRKFNITCDRWSVRGHFRHYRNGNIVWIPSYEKGKKRNTNGDVRDRIYMI